MLLEELREAGASEQGMVLADRIAAEAPLRGLSRLPGLIWALLEVGRADEATNLARRVAADAPVDTEEWMPGLLDAVRAASTDHDARVLAERAATHAPLNDELDRAALIGDLWDAGEPVLSILAERLPGAGGFRQLVELGNLKEHFKFGREPDGSPAPPWTWDDLQ
ncbi:hypothetical protein [Kitasatospora sp. GP82]|uniref:hypothetical protein n=1 Tax=Kitasatospora sp. GP82 TaxID=3035089 RepID=UPI002475D4A1|nr:hypothetical protein [Kitasatospora sp. GP82]MDH6130525.1 hypothetical protein [Kitasatospora sp. GP82]